MLGEPALQLRDGDEHAATYPDHAKLGQNVVFEEVDAYAEGAGGLWLGEGQARPRSAGTRFLPVHAGRVDRRLRGVQVAHPVQSRARRAYPGSWRAM
jgi:hypothetical protein